MFKKLIALAIVVFVLGWMSHTFYSDLLPARADPEQAAEPMPSLTPDFSGRERASPADRLKVENVHVTSTRVVIDGIPGRAYETAIFTNTNSMDPLIDDGSQAIQIVPKGPDEIKVGDIISYDSGSHGIIIHRVIQISKDDNGWYATVKGDNNPSPDPIKVRFQMIRRVLVGVLY
jgi:hypothetical protein